jgi:phosphoribosylformylglycinamidine synthase
LAKTNEGDFSLMKRPKVCILTTDGTNCDEELFYAFEKFGAEPESVHVNLLRQNKRKFEDYQILAIPGGFSYGDDVVSGKILAVEMMSFLKDQLGNFIVNKGLILGICNGFQVLARTGLLPFGEIGKMDVTLGLNESGHFECRWVNINVEKSRSLFLNENVDTVAQIAVNHGEGRFFATKNVINDLKRRNLVVFRYVDANGKQTQEYHQNPNGSIEAIAGICDPSGKILGLMPHPEKFVDTTQHPNWGRTNFRKPQGSFIFEKMIKFAKES